MPYLKEYKMINYETLNEQIKDFSSKNSKEKYVLSFKIYKMLAQFDPGKVIEILTKTSILQIFDRAKSIVEMEIKEGMILFPEAQFGRMTLLFKDDKKDLSDSFFDIEKLALKLGKDTLSQILIIGFFMNESRMNIIQAYHLLEVIEL